MRLPKIFRQVLGECRFADACKKSGLYDPEGRTCNNDAGMYYDPFRSGGCYDTLKAQEDGVPIGGERRPKREGAPAVQP